MSFNELYCGENTLESFVVVCVQNKVLRQREEA